MSTAGQAWRWAWSPEIQPVSACFSLCVGVVNVIQNVILAAESSTRLGQATKVDFCTRLVSEHRLQVGVLDCVKCPSAQSCTLQVVGRAACKPGFNSRSWMIMAVLVRLQWRGSSALCADEGPKLVWYPDHFAQTPVLALSGTVVLVPARLRLQQRCA